MISAKEAKALTLSKEILAPVFKLCEDKVIRAAKAGVDRVLVCFSYELTEPHKVAVSKELRMLGYEIQWDRNNSELVISWRCA